jgi:hypothetical protein
MISKNLTKIRTDKYINKFKSIYFIMDEEQVQDPKHHAEKVFEDDNILIVSPLTNEANGYYGGKGPWYEEGYYGNREFEKRLENGGKIYHIINKTTGEKDSFYKDQYGQLFYNEITKLKKDDIDNLIKFAPTAKKVLNDITGSDIFKKLKQFAKGKIDKNTLIHSDDLIYDIKVNSNSLGDSAILLRYDEDEGLFNVLELSDDDIWFLNLIMSQDYDFIDSDRMWDDNKSGYGIFSLFNDSNTNKLKEISKLVLPNEKFNKESEDFLGKLYRKLDEYFDRQLDAMNWVYMDEYNDKSSENARNEIGAEINNYLNDKGFTLIRKYDTLSISIGDLVYLYSITGRRYDDLKALLENILGPKGGRHSVGGWGDNFYEYEGRVDTEKLNNEFEFQLGKIWDSLSEDEGMQEYFKLHERIVSKYKLNTWYSTPKDTKILFRIKKIDPETLKIEVDLRKSGGDDWDKTHYFTEENFNKFLHQPELFSIFDEK